MTAEESSWHYVRDGKPCGPALGETITHAEIQPDTLVWRKGMTTWTPALDTPLGDLVFGVPPPIKDSAALVEPILPPEPVAPSPVVEPSPTPSTDEAAKSKGYFAQHWRGDLSLARSYWVNVALFGGVVNIAVAAFYRVAELSVQSTAVAFFPLLALLYAIGAWQIVGLFRSLRMHEFRGGTASGTFFGWIGLSILVVGGVVITFASIYPAAQEMMNIVRGDQGVGQLEIRLLASGREIEIKGGIQAGSAAEFREFIKKIPQATVLHIDSTGGRMAEAFKIADIVAQRGMTTYVEGQCMSAATVIFVAGKERFAKQSARFGFHSVSFPGMSTAALADFNMETETRMEKAGVSSSFAQRASQTPATDMWMPSMPELVEAGVVQRITNGEQFGMSSLQLSAFEKMEGELLTMGAYKNFKAFDGPAYDELVRVMKETAASGASQAEVIAKMQAQLIASLTEAVPFASDAALVRMIDHQINVGATFIETHPAELYDFLMDLPLAPGAVQIATLPQYPTKEGLALVEEIFGTAAGRPVHPLDSEQVAKSLQLVMERVAVLEPGAIEAIANPEKLANDPKRRARALVIFLKTIRDILSPEQAAAIMRSPE